jgi:agmatinase
MSSPVTVCHQEFDESHFLASEYEPARPEQAAFHIIPVPLEQSVSYGGGTAHGPAAILSASQQLEAWDGISAPGEAGLYTAPAVDCDAPIETVLDRIEAATAHALRCKALPVILGGEHTVSLGALRALAAEAAHTGEPFGVVQFDAHADLRSQYEGSIYSHASVMHRAVADLGLPLAQFAMRDFCREEVEVRRQYNVLHYDADVLFRQACRNSPCPRTFPAASTSPSTWTVWMPR